jgi:DOPA 4,5-dioxygenase
MADPSSYDYPSPLAGYENAPPLPDERAADGKSYVNPETGKLSVAYEKFVEPLDNGVRGAFDVHVYYFPKNTTQLKFARELWERIRREFPELRIYRFWEEPVGPHPIAMFEVNLFTPAQFGAFIPWLVINRGPLSVLVHPNTVDPVTGEHDEELRNHTQRATWMGEKWMGEKVVLDSSVFKNLKALKSSSKEVLKQK